MVISLSLLIGCFVYLCNKHYENISKCLIANFDDSELLLFSLDPVVILSWYLKVLLTHHSLSVSLCLSLSHLCIVLSLCLISASLYFSISACISLFLYLSFSEKLNYIQDVQQDIRIQIWLELCFYHWLTFWSEVDSFYTEFNKKVKKLTERYMNVN